MSTTKTITIHEWRDMSLHAEPHKTHGRQKKDSDDNIWEWITSTARRVTIKRVAINIDDLPPSSFSNHINDLQNDGFLIGFSFRGWRKSPEWKLYVAGYNAAVEKCNDQIQSKYNMGETANRLFGTE